MASFDFLGESKTTSANEVKAPVAFFRRVYNFPMPLFVIFQILGRSLIWVYAIVTGYLNMAGAVSPGCCC